MTTERTAEEVAREIVGHYCWTTNIMRDGRLVGQQTAIAADIATAIHKERDALTEARAEIERLRGEKSYLQDEVIPALRSEVQALSQKDDGGKESTEVESLGAFAADIRRIMDECEQDYHICGKCGHQDNDATMTSNLFLLLQDRLSQQQG